MTKHRKDININTLQTLTANINKLSVLLRRKFWHIVVYILFLMKHF